MTTPTDVTVSAVALEASAPLTLQDRCDRCGAQAFVRTSVMATDKLVDLLFCGHHFAKHEAKLREISLNVLDERERINEKASASSGTTADDK